MRDLALLCFAAMGLRVKPEDDGKVKPEDDGEVKPEVDGGFRDGSFFDLPMHRVCSPASPQAWSIDGFRTIWRQPISAFVL